MRKITAYLTVGVIFLSQLSLANAADVEVMWTNPGKYSDIDAGNEHKKHFKTRVFKKFEEHFAKLAMALPDEQKLVLDITNVDLAGDVNFGGINRVRIIKDLYFPKMKFSYQLLDADRRVIKGEDVSIKDMSFLMHSRLKYNNQTLGYEKEMLDDWFRKTFMEK